MTLPADTYTLLVLRDAKPDDVEYGPANVRLRLAMKSLLRRYGFRCSGAIETPHTLAEIITAVNQLAAEPKGGA